VKQNTVSTETHPTPKADGNLGERTGRTRFPLPFLCDLANIKVVPVERHRLKTNDWGLKSLLVERKTFKAIYIPFFQPE
jgi:hypothetical protein